mmetsp:Transcript_24153/g.35400  ORF Transcript_24153/g.35400 Transcript_24153/m.35400 type:complete len:84 (-) Transcript_24153:2-253(-)
MATSSGRLHAHTPDARNSESTCAARCDDALNSVTVGDVREVETGVFARKDGEAQDSNERGMSCVNERCMSGVNERDMSLVNET